MKKIILVLASSQVFLSSAVWAGDSGLGSYLIMPVMVSEPIEDLGIFDGGDNRGGITYE